MMAGSTGQPLLLSTDGVERPRPIPVTSSLIDEAYIQELLHRHPELIPIDELPRVHGPLLSLGREISTSAGSIDNLFVSPEGDITIVEAKLWRNPEARRKVVAQILDYASALAALNYEQFDRLAASNTKANSLWSAVSSAWALPAEAEAAFIDSVSRNLGDGNFLLLIVGDGIREDVVSLTETLGKHPRLGFHLELVEIQLYEMANGDRLVVPSIVGRSKEVTRAIVEVTNDATGAVIVNVDAVSEAEVRESKDVIGSIDDFRDRVAETAPESAEALAELARWWEEEGALRFNSNSVALLLEDHGPKPGRAARVALLWENGDVEYPNLSLARRVGLSSEEELDARARQHGFVGVKRLTRPGNVLQPADIESVRELIAWTADAVRLLKRNREMPS